MFSIGLFKKFLKASLESFLALSLMNPNTLLDAIN
jgi:arginine exporter protein ArgO